MKLALLGKLTASLLLIGTFEIASAGVVPLIDNSGNLRLGSLAEPTDPERGTYVLVASPGTPSPLVSTGNDDVDDAGVPLSSASSDCLLCRGATLSGTSEADRLSLGTCSLVASAVIVDGVTVGDLQAGLADSRHGRTLTALFRARSQLLAAGAASSSSSKQTLIVVVHGEENAFDKEAITTEIQTVFQAVDAEKNDGASFEDMYEIFLMTAKDTEKVRNLSPS